jgi:hypothetical protein
MRQIAGHILATLLISCTQGRMELTCIALSHSSAVHMMGDDLKLTCNKEKEEFKYKT